MKEEFGEEPPVDINSPEIHNVSVLFYKQKQKQNKQK